MKISAPAGRLLQDDDHMLPMINVVLLLMVFFMMVSAIKPPPTLDIEDVESSGQEQADASEQSLYIGQEGQLGLSGEIFGFDQIGSTLARWQTAHPGETLQVRADAQVRAQYVVSVLQAIREAGVERSSLLAVQRQQP
tara:strand:+ start:370 stop:783 length:414 start_codon:yes stop_codon:yes gene_type:complete